MASVFRLFTPKQSELEFHLDLKLISASVRIYFTFILVFGCRRIRNLIIKRKLRKQRHQQRLQQRLHLRFSQAGKQIEESSSTQAFTHMRGPDHKRAAVRFACRRPLVIVPIACGQMLWSNSFFTLFSSLGKRRCKRCCKRCWCLCLRSLRLIIKFLILQPK